MSTTRHRRFQLSMQAWFCLNAPQFDDALVAGMPTSAIAGHFALLLREYRLLAGWRRPFRV